MFSNAGLTSNQQHVTSNQTSSGHYLTTPSQKGLLQMAVGNLQLTDAGSCCASVAQQVDLLVQAEVVVERQAEFAGPAWMFGSRSYQVLPDSR